MNTKILQKCLDELNKESPRLDYLRGMLETLVEMQETPLQTKVYRDIISPNPQPFSYKAEYALPPSIPEVKDEGGMLDTIAAAAMRKMPPLQTE